MSKLKKVDPEIWEIIRRETLRERNFLELIASENFCSEAVLEAQGSALTNKYAEGYPGRRYYGGCEEVDKAEILAIERAKKLFGAEHANVQPHSGSQANMAAYFALLDPGDTLLSMSLPTGGHLTHGAAVSFSGRLYTVHHYGVSKETEMIDYDEVARIAEEFRPKMIVAGASSYSRTIDFERFRAIADSVGALLMVDMAHIAGLVAAGLHPSPVPVSDVVTTTTHKTLRGPRAGLILCKAKHAKAIDHQVFPGIQGGPLMHVIAAKAVAFKEAMQDSFKVYQEHIIKNAQALAAALREAGLRIVSGGTDIHLFLIDLTDLGITGNEAEKVLERTGIVVNKNPIPFDEEAPSKWRGIRLGTPAVTTRGMKEPEMDLIAGWMGRVLKNQKDDKLIVAARKEVCKLCQRYPTYHIEPVRAR